MKPTVSKGEREREKENHKLLSAYEMRGALYVSMNI
jgi:hypothetical protein